MAKEVVFSPIMTKSDYAGYRGVTTAAVSQWIRGGRIVLDPNGNVDVIASDIKHAQTAQGGGVKGTPGPRPGQSLSAAAVQADGITLIEAKITKARIESLLTQMDYQKQIGKLVDRAEYDRALGDALTPTLSQLDTLSARIGSRVAAAHGDPRETQQIIDEEVRAIRAGVAAALRELALNGASYVADEDLLG